MFTVKRLGEDTEPKKLSEEQVIELLTKSEPSSIDVKKYPDIDILIAMDLYPNSTYDDLVGYGFERFEDIWVSYVPDFVDKGLVQKAPENRYSLTEKGEKYLILKLV